MKRDIAKWRETQRKGAANYRDRLRERGRSRIRPVSAKRAAENRERARLRPLVVGGPCEARLEGCTGIATDWHERRSRARGGSITSVENAVGLCRACHTQITERPKWAAEHGWALSRYG